MTPIIHLWHLSDKSIKAMGPEPRGWNPLWFEHLPGSALHALRQPHRRRQLLPVKKGNQALAGEKPQSSRPQGIQNDSPCGSKSASGFQAAFIFPLSSRWFPPASLILSILRFFPYFLDSGRKSAVWLVCCALTLSITYSRAVVNCYLFFIHRWLHKSHSPYLKKSPSGSWVSI